MSAQKEGYTYTTGLFLLNPKYCQNEIWSNTSELYDKHFQHVFGSLLETGN